ncbi:conserved hypothetical protein [Gammaproteobacteria bacterium]
MSNEIFPELPGLKWDSTKKPLWSTKIHETTNGKETRAAYWSYPKWFFSLSYEFLDDSDLVRDLQTIGGFFLARKGRFDSFLYRDDSDFSVVGQVLGTGDGIRGDFQIFRSFGDFDEPIKNIKGATDAAILVVSGIPSAPIPSGAPTVYVDGVTPQTYGITTSGLLTISPAPAPGSIITADFSFYFRCRFVQDEAEFSQFMAALWEMKKLEMVTVK